MATIALDSPVERLAQALTDVLADLVSTRPPPDPARAPMPSWRERLWLCPPDTRLGLAEVCEALGRSKGFVYRLTRTKDIPHRKLDGVLVFKAGDVRDWVKLREDVIARPAR